MRPKQLVGNFGLNLSDGELGGDRAHLAQAMVMTEQITVSVDSDVANIYRSVSDKERRKLDLLVNLRLRDATESEESLQNIMRKISRNAQRRGLTPDILQSILDEE